MRMILCFGLVVLSVKIWAQSVPIVEVDPKQYVLPIRPERTISFETNEGSHMNVDVSPDGRTIAFDLLGDLYTIPATGGRAKQLTRGIAINVCPVWSPDGTKIAYLSDATGFFHLTVRDTGGTFVRTFGIKEKQFELDTYNVPIPVWSPDGTFIAAGQAIYHINGSKVVFERELPGYLMALLPNGDFYYHTTKNRFGGLDDTVYRSVVAKDSKSFVVQYDRSKKVSPDGEMIAYRSQDSLRVVNVSSGVVSKLGDFPMEGWFAKNYAFSKDNRFIYLSYGGKIHRVETQTGKREVIPFWAQVNVDIGSLKYNRYRIPRDSVSVLNARCARKSPDGKYLVFSCLNRLYIKDLPNGKPRLLVNQSFDQLHPAWSPDGKWITFVSREGFDGDGYLWKVPSLGGRPQQLLKQPGHYDRPCWSPDGNSIMVSVRYATDNKTEVSVGNIEVKIVEGFYSTFSENGEEIFSQISKVPDSGFVLVQRKTEGKDLDERVVFPVFFLGQVVHSSEDLFSMSPDKRYVFYRSSENLFLMPVVNLNRKQFLFPSPLADNSSLIRITGGAWDPTWEEGGKVISWTSGDKYYRVGVEKVLSMVEKNIELLQKAHLEDRGYFVDAKVEPDEVVSLSVKVANNYAKGTIVLKNARIVKMCDNQVIERGTIVVKDGIIVGVGISEEIKAPHGSTIIDLSGKTIIPGLIDLHAHIGKQDYRACLAFGVTTARNPSERNEDYANTEMLATGRWVGPRYFTAGNAVYPSLCVNSMEEARTIVEQRAKYGGVFMKQYSLPSRIQKQWLLMASQEHKLNMTNEGRTYWEQLGMIKDGVAGIEHAIFNPSYSKEFTDIVKLWARSGTYFAPTLIKSTDGPGSYGYYRYLYQNLDSVKLKRFWREGMWNTKTLEYSSNDTMVTFEVPSRSKLYAAIRRLGGNVVMDSHGDDPGIGAHYAIWALHRGGLSNYESLECATILGAGALGVQSDLGSIELGKIADLLVLDSDPLADIHNTTTIKYIMKGGILYDDETLEVVWPLSMRKLRTQIH